MDISKLRPVRMSPYIKDSIINDCFPDFDEVPHLSDDIEPAHRIMHNGAWCLYTALLFAKVHEKEPLSLNPYFKERAKALFECVKNDKLYFGATDEEIVEAVNQIIKTDIRNCFAHGDFSISYDVYTKKLYFVLKPKKDKYQISEPILISKQDMISAISNEISAFKKNVYFLGTKDCVNRTLETEWNNLLQKGLLPETFLKNATYYLNNKAITNVEQKKAITVDNVLHNPVIYALLSAKITYEQRDYYNMFGDTSTSFQMVRLIRNSCTHNGNNIFVNDEDNKRHYILHNDRTKSKNDSLINVVYKLDCIDMVKDLIMFIEEQKEFPQQKIEELKNKLKVLIDRFNDESFDVRNDDWGFKFGETVLSFAMGASYKYDEKRGMFIREGSVLDKLIKENSDIIIEK